jgi:hypothetical protein
MASMGDVGNVRDPLRLVDLALKLVLFRDREEQAGHEPDNVLDHLDSGLVIVRHPDPHDGVEQLRPPDRARHLDK